MSECLSSSSPTSVIATCSNPQTRGVRARLKPRRGDSIYDARFRIPIPIQRCGLMWVRVIWDPLRQLVQSLVCETGNRWAGIEEDQLAEVQRIQPLREG